jgi:hypothetical protein
MALPLSNCVIEKQMPKGYTWAKFVRCWTGDPAKAKFFEEKTDDVGNIYPAAYFTTLITYDRDQGFIERDIKLQGTEALWAALELQERSQVALVSCEGHIYTKAVEYGDTTYVRSTVIVKQGTVAIHEYEHQAPPTMAAPAQPSPQDCGLTEYEEPAGSEDGSTAPFGAAAQDGAPF